MKHYPTDYVRNAVFGVEDSLVSTVGILFGLAASDAGRHAVALTACVVVAVEATSMAVGAFLSQKSELEMGRSSRRAGRPSIDAIIMLLSYAVAGTIPTIPYLLMDVGVAKYYSVLFTLAALFMLGWLPVRKLRDGLEFVVLGGLAIMIGYAVGQVFRLPA